jgi:ADP-heptose:LPS heptosyltransferase
MSSASTAGRPWRAGDGATDAGPFDRILFVELLSGIGDLIIALPAIQALGRSHPDAELTVLTYFPGGDLLREDPLIDRVVYAPRRPRLMLDDLLTRQRFDLVVSDSRFDGIHEAIERCGARRTVTNLWHTPPPDRRVGDRFLDILLGEQLIAPTAMAPARLHVAPRERAWAERKLSDRHPLVFLVPDAGMPIKRWPGDRYVAVGRALRQDAGAAVVVAVGSDSNQSTAIATAIGGDARIWPRGALRRLAAALSCADLVVAPDSGPAHISAALGVPTITLFGPSWHQRYGQPAPHVNLQGCPGCPERLIADFTKQQCWYAGLCPIAPWRTCLEDISPDEVLAAALPILGARREPDRS